MSMNGRVPNSPKWELRVNFECNFCGMLTGKAVDLVPHIIDVECKGMFFQCALCSLSFFKMQSFIQHSSDKHGSSTGFLSCPLCVEKVIPLDNMGAHVMKTHWSVKQTYCCLSCPYKTTSRNIQQHMKLHEKKNPCQTDSSANRDMNMFNKILENFFPKFDIYSCCSYCDDTFTSVNSLHQHTRDKHGINKSGDYDIEFDLVCKICEDYKCEKKETFHKHMKSKHMTHNFNCPFNNCKYSNEKFWEFGEHFLNSHIMNRIFKCPICKTTFPKENSLLQHIDNKHSGQDFMNICQCIFVFRSMSSHLKKDHDIKMEVVVCRLCNTQITGDFNGHVSEKHNIKLPEGLKEFCADL